jgi:hypothetical protein
MNVLMLNLGLHICTPAHLGTPRALRQTVRHFYTVHYWIIILFFHFQNIRTRKHIEIHMYTYSYRHMAFSLQLHPTNIRFNPPTETCHNV